MVPLLCADVFQLCTAVQIPKVLFWLSVYVVSLHRLEKSVWFVEFSVGKGLLGKEEEKE